MSRKDTPHETPITPIVCRCEDITEAEVKEAIESGMESLDELKRALRLGMGPCQGRTCGPILVSMLSRILKRKNTDFDEWTQRPPLKPVPAKIFFQESDNE